MQTDNIAKRGNTPDLLSGILSVQVRNEDKITEHDRIYCQSQQDLLYKTLDQIDRWYALFKEDAEQYKEKFKFKYEENGKTTYTDLALFPVARPESHADSGAVIFMLKAASEYLPTFNLPIIGHSPCSSASLFFR